MDSGVSEMKLVHDNSRQSGLQSTIWDETVKIAGADPDFHHRDMFEAIAAGNGS